MAGRFLLGTSLFHLGQLAASREQFDQALRAEVRSLRSALALFAGPDVGVFCRVYLPMCSGIWAMRSKPREQRAAIALAREVSHPFSLAIALDYAAMLNVFRREANSRCSGRGSMRVAGSMDSPTTWPGPTYWRAGRPPMEGDTADRANAVFVMGSMH